MQIYSFTQLIAWSLRVGKLAAPNLRFRGMFLPHMTSQLVINVSLRLCAGETVKILTVKMWATAVKPAADIHEMWVCRGFDFSQRYRRP